MDLVGVMICEVLAAGLLGVVGSILIDHFFKRQEEIINRMTTKGDV